MGLAIGAAAIGFLAGLVVPSTRVEDEKLGPVADQVKDKVKETGQEALDRGRQVAQEVASTAADTAKQKTQEHGQELADSARQNAQDVGDQATQTTTGHRRCKPYRRGAARPGAPRRDRPCRAWSRIAERRSSITASRGDRSHAHKQE